MLNKYALHNLTVEKWAPTQTGKQPESGRASTTKEYKKCSFFQKNYNWSESHKLCKLKVPLKSTTKVKDWELE